MNNELIQLLNRIMSRDAERCNDILFAQYHKYIDLIGNINRKSYHSIGTIIPFFWQFPDSWGSLIPGAEKGNTWLLLSQIVYDPKVGVTGVVASAFHSFPPDAGQFPIKVVPDNVLVAVIQLLLEEMYCEPKHRYKQLFEIECQNHRMGFYKKILQLFK